VNANVWSIRRAFSRAHPHRSTALFVPRLPAAYAVWMGAIKTPQQWKDIYAVDEVNFVDELADKLRSAHHAAGAARPVLVLKGLNTDSKLWATPGAWLARPRSASGAEVVIRRAACMRI